MVRQGRVLEPIRELYKVEVRELGAALGLDAPFLERHPFPGPGLGVRLLCSPGAPAPAELTRITSAADQRSRPHGLRAVALPIRSVGVKADLRSYEWPVLLCGAAPWERILEVANRVYREVDGVNRCCYDLTGRSQPPRLELLPGTVTRDRLDLLREADALVMDGLARHGLMKIVWQCPTVALPLRVDGAGREFIVVRPVLSERAMTARPARLPDALLGELRAQLLALPGVGGGCIDVTTKPPGTIEWE
jgi:GMP synthase (glutamine-hydrolysing)